MSLDTYLMGLGFKFLIIFLMATLCFWGLVIWTLRSIGSRITVFWIFLWVTALPIFWLLNVPLMFHAVLSAVTSVFMVIQLKYYGEF